ncbi:hypothetical protein PPYR_15480 [Photinus pyralis]|uniref:DDE Tnp4 domain-containing protein n=1 Tax=Photinus pyralis TaxID=7054 RepID=A0A5N4A0C5_PHOPY|nr:hypothetical protein PPYR_15480 [Photinus pyralis]
MDLDIVNLVLYQEIMEDNFPTNIAIDQALMLADPLPPVEQAPRRPVPRNENYYEETIAQYMGDLFSEHFRMTRPTFEQLLITVGNANGMANHAIPLEKKRMFSIWILAKPETFLAAGDRFGLARSTAHGVFKEIIFLILEMMPQFITWPQNNEHTINVFYERSGGFPEVVGAIYGCHIPVKQPPYNAQDYYNRKQFHSIILQGICDHQLRFLNVHVGMPGRVHDARVLRVSPIYAQLTNVMHPLLPANQHLLGDSAYPLMKNLLTPYRDNGHLNDTQTNFNYKLSSDSFLSQGTSMQDLAWNYFIGKTTVHCIVKETCRVLWEQLQPLPT